MGTPWLTLQEARVQTGQNKPRMVDLCIVTKEQVRALQGSSAVFQTPPLLVIEVVSPDSIKRDYRHKRSEYAALGIPEYWIVDPLEAKITLLQLEEGFYDETVLHDRQPLCSPLFPDLTLTPEQVWAAAVIE
jgi:Uma2 family endonuclease